MENSFFDYANKKLGLDIRTRSIKKIRRAMEEARRKKYLKRTGFKKIISDPIYEDNIRRFEELNEERVRAYEERLSARVREMDELKERERIRRETAIAGRHCFDSSLIIPNPKPKSLEEMFPNGQGFETFCARNGFYYEDGKFKEHFTMEKAMEKANGEEGLDSEDWNRLIRFKNNLSEDYFMKKAETIGLSAEDWLEFDEYKKNYSLETMLRKSNDSGLTVEDWNEYHDFVENQKRNQQYQV